MLKQYLQIFCYHQQHDWTDLFINAEYIMNSIFNVNVKESLFFLMYEYHSCCDWIHQLNELILKKKIFTADECVWDL